MFVTRYVAMTMSPAVDMASETSERRKSLCDEPYRAQLSSAADSKPSVQCVFMHVHSLTGPDSLCCSSFTVYWMDDR
jgi:hypothetical protein